MPPDGLSWGDIQRWFDGRFDRIEMRLDGIEERVRSVEQAAAVAKGKGKVLGALMEWARYIVTGIIGAVGSRYLWH